MIRETTIIKQDQTKEKSMKVLLVILFLLSTVTFATDYDENICSALYDEAVDNCKVIMCTEWLSEDGVAITKDAIDECINSGDGDLLEGAQICADDGGEFESLIQAYNTQNPTDHISCEDF